MEEKNVVFQVKKTGIVMNTQWSVIVDNKCVGKIDFKNDLKINLPKGKHTVQYKVGFQKTKVLDINVENENIIVECIYDGTVNNFHIVGDNQDTKSEAVEINKENTINNNEKNSTVKNISKGKKISLLSLAICIIVCIIISFSGDDTKTNTINKEQYSNIPSYIVKSDKLLGAEFSFDLKEFVTRYNSYIYEYCNGDESFIAMLELDMSDFKDITKETLQYAGNNSSGLVKRYTGRSTHLGSLSNNSTSDGLIIDYYSEGKIGKIGFMTYSGDINNGETVSNIFQSIFNMPKDKALTTIENIKSHNKSGETVGHDTNYCIKWETTKSGNVTYFNIIPIINQ